MAKPLDGTRPWIDVTELDDRTLRSVVVGWHVYEGSRTPSRLFLQADEQLFEVCTAGDGSLQLSSATTPEDFDMEQYGRCEFEPIDDEHRLFVHLGSRIRTARRIVWRHTAIGWRLETEVGVVVLANQADEIFLSTGELPPDYSEATIEI